MVIQNIASNVRQRIDMTSQMYRGLWHTCRDTQRQAMTIVARNSRSVANTEVGAAKNIYTSARAAFQRAKNDGLKKVAKRPSRYVPAGRKQMRAAYRATLSLLNKTRTELTEVAIGGYQRMSAQLAAGPEGLALPASNRGRGRGRVKKSGARGRKAPRANSKNRPVAGKSRASRTTVSSAATRPDNPPTSTDS
ncbi:hypothetical protein V5738_14835 [Salinisphaera sp. SPP-AMP-43]|uniref:hypothetical protein n=1 Tax=Salinisphaera sp. SPP-AMP-43 TaxID=3121288 RepID=UPI003C6DC186